MNTPEYTTTRIWVQTLRMLKLIAAMTNESMVKVMDRLAKQELERLKKQEGKDDGKSRTQQ
jgi:hypothetical protein